MFFFKRKITYFPENVNEFELKFYVKEIFILILNNKKYNFNPQQ